MHQPHHHQTVDWFRYVDGMSAGDRYTCFATHGCAPGENLADRFERDLVERHADEGQGHDGLAAHGVDVGDGIGGSDTTKVVGIIDDGREEVGSGDQCL